MRSDLLLVVLRWLGRDANHLWTAFRPSNVAIHRVNTAAELGDMDKVRHHHLSRKIVVSLVRRSVGTPSVELEKLAVRVNAGAVN